MYLFNVLLYNVLFNLLNEIKLIKYSTFYIIKHYKKCKNIINNSTYKNTLNKNILNKNLNIILTI